MFGSRKGQSTLEYVILVGFVVAALVAMGVYMKRGIQGKLRESSDQVGEQYSAYNTRGKYTTISKTHQYEKTGAQGETTTTLKEVDYNKNYQARQGWEQTDSLALEKDSTK